MSNSVPQTSVSVDIDPAHPFSGRRSGVAKALRTLRKALVMSVLAAALVFAGALVLFRFVGPFGSINMMITRANGTPVSHRTVPLTRISPNLVRAVIAAEDARFCEHSGFDLDAISRAVSEKESRGYLRGASTISQQTAKNVFFWNGGGWVRKGGETVTTASIETFWTKRRIMEAYLNVAEWGDGLYGAEAAAQGRFGVSAADLTPWQAALLASVLPSPNKWKVKPAGPYVQKRARQIMGRMNTVAGEHLDACVLGA